MGEIGAKEDGQSSIAQSIVGREKVEEGIGEESALRHLCGVREFSLGKYLFIEL